MARPHCARQNGPRRTSRCTTPVGDREPILRRPGARWEIWRPFWPWPRRCPRDGVAPRSAALTPPEAPTRGPPVLGKLSYVSPLAWPGPATSAPARLRWRGGRCGEAQPESSAGAERRRAPWPREKASASSIDEASQRVLAEWPAERAQADGGWGAARWLRAGDRCGEPRSDLPVQAARARARCRRGRKGWPCVRIAPGIRVGDGALPPGRCSRSEAGTILAAPSPSE